MAMPVTPASPDDVKDQRLSTMSTEEFLRALPPPDWLRRAWDHAKRHGLDQMTDEEINDEIAAYRREKRDGEAK